MKENMQVTIDISTAINESAGVGRYTRNLVENLLQEKSIDFSLFASFWRQKEKKIEILNGFKKNNTLVKSLFWPGKLKEFFWSNPVIDPIKMIFPKTRLFHAPTFLSVPQKTGKTIVTIHDVAYDIYPENVSPGYQDYFHKLTQRALDKSTTVISISQSTKEGLIQYYRVDPQKIKVIYLGVEKKFFIKNKVNSIKIAKKYGLPKNFLLFVGTLEPRKNLVNLVKAYQLLPEKIVNAYPLVIVGKSGWLFDKIVQDASNLTKNKKIIFTGYVEDQDLPAIYQKATVFVFPSLHEGFGFPILEAMAGGVPVITSNCSSLSEIADRSALLVNPQDYHDIARKINLLIKNHTLRMELKAKGLKQAQRFSWEKCARETVKLYQEVYGKN